LTDNVPIEGHVSTTTPAITSTAQTGAAAQPSPGGLGAISSQEFLDLLVAQISNQDPLNPLSSSQFMSQTAELSTLEQVTALNQEMSQVLATQQLQAALSAIGHTATGTGPNGQTVSGTVTAVQDTSSGPLLDIGSSEVPMSDITTIS
jgi:flagellar basal-body rod modification protein FlgD